MIKSNYEMYDRPTVNIISYIVQIQLNKNIKCADCLYISISSGFKCQSKGNDDQKVMFVCFDAITVIKQIQLK